MKNSWKGKSHYEFYKNGSGRFLYHERFRYIKNTLAKIMHDDNAALVPKKMIDMGCGDGLLANELKTDGLLIIATDSDTDRIYRARQGNKINSRLIVSDVLHPVFKDDSADIILIHHVMEHIEDSDTEIIRICRGILKKGGYLILGVPNEGSFLGRLSRSMHPWLYAKGEHVNFYCEEYLVSLLEGNGLTVDSVGRIGFLFPVYYMHMAFISLKPLFYFRALSDKDAQGNCGFIDNSL